ncbi:CCR4-NOT transcription complex subunit 6-like-B isoform X2 [Centruroides vittatus]|uniref:CCR4-NOT transcription complex subunit 6-like-B isoform X2 n=1 Tax=Centruroides vittatus TaxID=120091 RepID=UPI0035103DF0
MGPQPDVHNVQKYIGSCLISHGRKGWTGLPIYAGVLGKQTPPTDVSQPYSRLAIHAQGAPLIVPPAESPDDRGLFYLTGNQLYVSASPPNPYSWPDKVNIGSEDSSTTSDTSLPRVIKPRKRRRRGKKTGSIVTLQPYQPLCYRKYVNENYCSSEDDCDSNDGIKTVTPSEPPERPWVTINPPTRTRPACVFTVMCYNVLCDKYATRQMYGYCPSWALSWEYRRKGIMNEIRHYSADIISLQEVETEQFYNFFLPELRREGFSGIFSPKSRAKTMSEGERKHVDGCAIFYRASKFTLIKEYLVEFNQLAMANAEGSDDMLNRVMTKDNIGLAALFQIKEGAYSNGLQPELNHAQPILACTAHIHWDPEFCDVKLIQTMMLMHELYTIAEEANAVFYPSSQKHDVNNIPLLLCGDFNSLPESGVIEFLSTGRVSGSHPDFKDFRYKESLRKFNYCDATNEYTHPFRITRTYNDGVMPYTNYTFDFKGIIDYVFYSKRHITELGVLGPLDAEWMRDNKIAGCPHPHIPSDHFPLLVELELSLPTPSTLIIPNDLILQR